MAGQDLHIPGSHVHFPRGKPRHALFAGFRPPGQGQFARPPVGSRQVSLVGGWPPAPVLLGCACTCSPYYIHSTNVDILAPTLLFT